MPFYRLLIDAFTISSAQAVRADRGTEIPLSPLFETSCVTVMDAEDSIVKGTICKGEFSRRCSIEFWEKRREIERIGGMFWKVPFGGKRSGIVNPLKFLSTLMGKKVIVTLKMDRQFVGTLTKTDAYMNLALEDAADFVNGKASKHRETCLLIRCNNLKMVQEYDEEREARNRLAAQAAKPSSSKKEKNLKQPRKEVQECKLIHIVI
ncbi:hypothetical protein CDAR_181121 [Caerostris darwini]|uniref:Sm domain-containing protein n=1 Tax=Caerostris darwini TaxID=1538125 RepID=A0AAV4U3X7_9ARAC|nr:hypothetical protein CDAR_181121 [Caerostris darwini]